MKKLRNKIFYTILGILSLAALTFIFIFNLQHYNEQYNVVKRSLNFNGLVERNKPNNEDIAPPNIENITHLNATIEILDLWMLMQLLLF